MEEVNLNAHTLQPDFSITPGAGNLPKLKLSAPDGARTEVYLYGAHVVSWVPAGGHERLFLSRASQFLLGAPIRGGIPVIFPQFGAYGTLPMHGFLRLMEWEFAGAQLMGDYATAIFSLQDSKASRALWPHAFQAELVVSVGGKQLEVVLCITNPGAESFSFTSSLHTYLQVSELDQAAVRGLAGLRYRDSAAAGAIHIETNPQIDFRGEVNRAYFNAPADALLAEPSQSLVIRKSRFTDTVIWNPGAEKCATMPDLEPEDYRRFVCVEAVTVGEPVLLAPGAYWCGAQTLLA